MSNAKRNAGVSGDPLASFPALACPVIIVAMALFQGGYYAGAVCAIGALSLVALAVAALLRKVELRFTWMNACLLVIAAAYALSAVAHGPTLTMVQEACTWLVLAGLSLWFSFDTQQAKRRALDALAGCGVAFAAAGLLIFASGIPVEGAVNAGRLMFPFQYANTSGLFFAVTALLCLGVERNARRLLSLVAIAALMLTQSGGAILVFGAGLLVMGVRWIRESRPSGRRIAVAACGFVLACAAAGLLLRDRAAQATQTLVERAVQAIDAIGLLGGNVLLGIGPDQWQFVYPEVQSAQYRAANVHCSYVQVALDAGVVALLALLAMVGIGLWRLVKCGDAVSAIGATMIALHALVDFDLMFAAMVMLLLLLIAEPRDAARSRALVVWGAVGTTLAWASVALALGASCLGVYLDVRVAEARQVALAPDPERTAAIMSASPFMGNDVLMKSYEHAALFSAGKYRELVALPEQDDFDAEMSLQRAAAHYQLGEPDEAAGVIARALHRFPYDPELYETAREIIEANGSGASACDLFNIEAARANELAKSGHAAWLANQVEIELIERSGGVVPEGEGR